MASAVAGPTPDAGSGNSLHAGPLSKRNDLAGTAGRRSTSSASPTMRNARPFKPAPHGFSRGWLASKIFTRARHARADTRPTSPRVLPRQ
jgi:hypothetical protein